MAKLGLGKPTKGKSMRACKTKKQFLGELNRLALNPSVEGLVVVMRWQNPKDWTWTSHHFHMIEEDFKIANKLIKAIKL